jgi:hypothetical protein
METIADNTGGHAFYNTNGLAQAMQQAIDQGSVYYTLTYSPTNPKFDGSIRHIKVQLDKDGFQLSYRKSYYAESASLEAGTPGVARTANPNPPRAALPDGTHVYDPMTALMKHGAPISSELFFEATVLPVEGVVPATAQEAAQLAQFSATPSAREAAAGKPPMVRHYEVSFFILWPPSTPTACSRTASRFRTTIPSAPKSMTASSRARTAPSSMSRCPSLRAGSGSRCGMSPMAAPGRWKFRSVHRRAPNHNDRGRRAC